MRLAGAACGAVVHRGAIWWRAAKNERKPLFTPLHRIGYGKRLTTSVWSRTRSASALSLTHKVVLKNWTKVSRFNNLQHIMWNCVSFLRCWYDCQCPQRSTRSFFSITWPSRQCAAHNEACGNCSVQLFKIGMMHLISSGCFTPQSFCFALCWWERWVPDASGGGRRNCA